MLKINDELNPFINYYYYDVMYNGLYSLRFWCLVYMKNQYNLHRVVNFRYYCRACDTPYEYHGKCVYCNNYCFNLMTKKKTYICFKCLIKNKQFKIFKKCYYKGGNFAYMRGHPNILSYKHYYRKIGLSYNSTSQSNLTFNELKEYLKEHCYDDKFVNYIKNID